MNNYTFQKYKDLKNVVDESKGIFKAINRVKLEVFVNRNSQDILQHSINLSIREYVSAQIIVASAQNSNFVKILSKRKQKRL